jgi:ADP-heptose:LPS heptosyltransferase
MMNAKPIKRIIVSRTDSIGDVVLTLPFCVWIKNHFQEASLVYLCKGYTKSVVECFVPVDEILPLEDLEQMTKDERKQALFADIIIHVFPHRKIAQWAKEANITQRIGTSHRWAHWIYCNERVDFTRKNSSQHEAQLNFHLLKPLGLALIPSSMEIQDMSANFCSSSTSPVSGNYIVLHPFSKGSAVEYPLEHYVELAKRLIEKGYKVVVSGTAAEAEKIGGSFDHLPGVINAVAKYSLPELIGIIQHAKGFVACSTGPLHLAGIMNVKTIGLFSPKKPIDPGRWSPLGTHTRCLVFEEECKECQRKKSCDCIEKIPVQRIVEDLVS